MRSKSVICCAVRTITRTVAAGVFVPGHLGELTRIVPFEMADAVLADAGRTERRLRRLPSRVGLYFVLALALFPQSGYLGVWAKLTAALDEAPSAKALRDLRRRLGPGPLRELFEVLAGPLGRARTPGVYFAGYRTVAFDGCRSIKVPDSVANRGSRRRRTLHPGQRALPIAELAAAGPIYAYSFILTDRDVSAAEQLVTVEHWYRHRTSIENVFRDGRHGAALCHLPSGHRQINRAWMWGALLAVSIAGWAHQLTGVLDPHDVLVGHGVRGGKAMIATLRRRLIATPARLVTHAGQLVLRPARGYELLAEILARIRALPALP